MYTRLTEETPLIQNASEDKIFLEQLKTNRRYVEIYVEEKKKELFQNVFSTPLGSRILRKDVECIVNFIKEYSLTHRACKIMFGISEKSGYGFVKQLAKIKAAINENKSLSGNKKIQTDWEDFAKAHATTIYMAVSQKTGLIPRDDCDFQKYDDGCYLNAVGDECTIYYWW